MSKKFVKVIFATLAIFVLIISGVLALAPETMVYQGRLADVDGNPITSQVSVLFSIYLSPDGGPADLVWSETIMVTPDEMGVFTVELGLVTPLTTGVFTGLPRYLAIKVGDDAEMTPRQLLASAPYAINSNIATGSITNTHISNSANISATKISGTAATLSGTHQFSGTNYFNDSTMSVNSTGVKIGEAGNPDNLTVLRVRRHLNHTSGLQYGIWSDIYTSGNNGGLVGAFIGSTSSATTAGINYALYTRATSNGTKYAAYFDGNVYVGGTLSKAAGSFKIDHPLDPANKYLSHSFVESPDMMNVYNGNVTTNDNGYATVQLPDYFEALNKDFRYQLTVIGTFSQAIVSDEINNNKFTIRTDKPSVKVSWQVTGIRQDAYAEAHRIKVEEDKLPEDKGFYLHPAAFKLGPEMNVQSNRIVGTEQEAGDSHD